jgi:DNA-binding transcriptional LysR family regulator
MDWRDLQIFLTVAEKGQLTRAAAALGMNAKTITRRLRHVETAMGSTLFEQTREGQVLPEAGAALLAHAEIMAQAAWDIEAQNGLGTAGLSGTLRISVAEGFGSWFLAKHLSNFASAYPDLTIDLVASSGFLSPSKREADIAVLLSRPKSGPMMTKKLSDINLVDKLARNHEHTKDPINIQDKSKCQYFSNHGYCLKYPGTVNRCPLRTAIKCADYEVKK